MALIPRPAARRHRGARGGGQPGGTALGRAAAVGSLAVLGVAGGASFQAHPIVATAVRPSPAQSSGALLSPSLLSRSITLNRAVPSVPTPAAPTPVAPAPPPLPQPTVPAIAVPPGLNARAATAVATALAQIGKPYQWAGAGPSAFDCSGLTAYAWRAAGVTLPHNAAAQAALTTPVPLAALQPGDLVFYYWPIAHVGLYIGNGLMVEAPHSGVPVRIAAINRPGLEAAGRPA